jgi:arabinose-5-phosphate isomerase
MISREKLCQYARSVVEIEASAINSLISRIDANFAKACEYLLHCEGRIIVIGMGKSGHIGKKIAATLASTGSPAFFVHPGEASHGDMGMITSKDILLAISNSGETSEILTLLPIIKHLKTLLITLTGKANSTLARNATVNIDISVGEEACPLGLAPTSSTTATLVMGDAIAITLLQAKGFNEHDFALYHPGGNLGKRLLLRIEHLMRIGVHVPIIREHSTIREALEEMTQKSLGMTSVLDKQGKLVGIYTDGDLRRTLSLNLDLQRTSIKDVMTKKYKTVEPDLLAIEALQIMEDHKITSLLVTDRANQLVGVAHIHDLLNAGL